MVVALLRILEILSFAICRVVTSARRRMPRLEYSPVYGALGPAAVGRPPQGYLRLRPHRCLSIGLVSHDGRQLEWQSFFAHEMGGNYSID